MAFCFIIGFVLGVGAAVGIYVLVREEFVELCNHFHFAFEFTLRLDFR